MSSVSPATFSFLLRSPTRNTLARHARAHPHRQLLIRQRPPTNAFARRYATAAESATSSSTTLPPPPTRRSLPIRFLRTVGLAIVSIPVGFVMATVPAVPAINELLSPPTDAETLALFQPYDERSAEINTHIVTHPLAEALRQDDSMIEARPFLKLPPAVQQHHLTSGALGGSGKLWVPPVTFTEREGKSIAIFLYLGRDMCGHPGIVHGGLLATLLDEGLARCCFRALPHKVGMTASLTIDYKALTPADTFVVLRAVTTKVEGRKAWVEGRIEEMDPPEGREPKVFATAKGLFIEPKQAATMQMIYPSAAG